MSVDDVVKALVNALTTTGRMSNTLFVYLSDNGLLMGEHHLYTWKNLPYRMATSIPMLVRWDGRIAPGTTDPDRAQCGSCRHDRGSSRRPHGH